MKTNRLKITFDLTCSDEVLTQLQAIIKDKGFEKPFDLVSLFPSYLRTSQVFIKEQLTDLDFTDGHLLALKIEGVNPIEKSAPLGNPAQPTEFNYLVVGSDGFIRDRERKKNRDRVIPEFPTVPEHYYTITESKGRRDLFFTAGIFEDNQIFETFCRANEQTPENVLDNFVVFICDNYNIGRGDNLNLANPKTYHDNITAKYGTKN